jgi:hypothetical protein
MLARMSFHSCADGATAFGITLILAIASKQRSLAGARADMVRTTSRILEGLMARLGLVEPRKGIGWPFLYWVVVAVEWPPRRWIVVATRKRNERGRQLRRPKRKPRPGG